MRTELTGMTIGRAALRVADLDRSITFYSDLLGLEAKRHGDGRATLSAAGKPLIELREVAGIPPRSQRSTGLFHIAILLPSRADLGAMLRRLAQFQVPIGASDHYVSEALYLSDPDGNGIEIYRDRPREEWPFSGAEVAMDTVPLKVKEVMAAAAPAAEPFRLPAGTTIGHMHLQVGDISAARAFYVQALGLDLMQDWNGQALFVSADGYHHHLGLNAWMTQGKGAAPKDRAGLDWFELELPDEAAVARLAAALPGAEPLEGGAAGFTARDPWQNELRVVPRVAAAARAA